MSGTSPIDPAAPYPHDLVLVSDRLTLRPYGAADQVALVAAMDDPETHRWLPALPNPYDLAVASAWTMALSHVPHELHRAVVRSADGTLVAGCGLARGDIGQGVTEIGYWVAPAARRQGVAVELVRALSGWALGPGRFARVELLADVRNAPSRAVALRAGYSFEGVLRGRGGGGHGDAGAGGGGGNHGAGGGGAEGRRDLACYSLLATDATAPSAPEVR